MEVKKYKTKNINLFNR